MAQSKLLCFIIFRLKSMKNRPCDCKQFNEYVTAYSMSYHANTPRLCSFSRVKNDIVVEDVVLNIMVDSIGKVNTNIEIYDNTIRYLCHLNSFLRSLCLSLLECSHTVSLRNKYCISKKKLITAGSIQ